MLPTKFQINWCCGFRGEDFFRNWPIRNKNCLWWPCLLTGLDEMSNIYRGPAIDASYQVSFHLAKRFQKRRFFLNRPIRNKNCLGRPCLLMDRDKMSNLQRGPSIDASYQVSLHLAEGFQRRSLKCEKLTDRRRTQSDGKSSNCLWQGEVKNYQEFQRFCLKNFFSSIITFQSRNYLCITRKSLQRFLILHDECALSEFAKCVSPVRHDYQNLCRFCQGLTQDWYFAIEINED